jgi:hypothetical protein
MSNWFQENPNKEVSLISWAIMVHTAYVGTTLEKPSAHRIRDRVETAIRCTPIEWATAWE